MSQGCGWSGRCLGWLAALLVLSHCGGVREGPLDDSSQMRESQPDAGDCLPEEGGLARYCTYRGMGGGFTTWVRHYGGLGAERLQAMASGAMGDFVAAGQFGAEPFPEGTGFALARYAMDGTPLWGRRVTEGKARVRALAVTPVGNILAVGTYEGVVDLGTGPLPEGINGSNLFIAKFAPDGRPVWARGFTATYSRDGQLEHWPIYPRAIATDAQGSLIVAGDFHGVMDLGGGPLFAGSASVFPRYETYSSGFLAKFTWNGDFRWSRLIGNGWSSSGPVTCASVASDSAGQLLVGGFASSETDLGDGVTGTWGPYIARYDEAGNLLWTRRFPDITGEVASVRPLGEDGVAFLADFAGTFTFAGQSYTAGDVSAPGGRYHTQPFFGTLSTTEGDGWLRALGEENDLWELTTHGSDSLTLTGRGRALDLGGGALGPEDSPRPFVARYGRAGEHHWSRVFDPDFAGHHLLFWGRTKTLAFFLVPQPGGAVVLGSDFTEPIHLEGNTAASRGASDLLYLQLAP